MNHSVIDMTGWIMKEHGVENSRLTIIEEDKACGIGRPSRGDSNS